MTQAELSADPAVLNAKRFREVLGHYPTGVTIVTAIGSDGRPAGMAVGSFTSVSLDPPLVAFLPDRGSSTFRKIRTGRSFCVNVLASEQEPLCRNFALKSTDKFAGIDWRPAESGAPILPGVVAWIDCDLDAVHETGDHYFVVGRVRSLEVATAGSPLVFFRGGYGAFAPLSLAAPAAPDLLEALRLADAARPEMEKLVADLRLRCVAVAAVGEQLVQVAAAGTPQSGVTHVGVRLPFMPPWGAPLIAWAEPSAFEAWVARLGAKLDAAQRRSYEESLAAVRVHGWSLSIDHPAFAAIDATLDKLAAKKDPMPDLERELRRLIANLDARFDPDRLREGERYDVRNLTAPVFGPGGKAVLMLTVIGLAQVRRAAIEACRDRMLEAARTVTGKLGGQLPGLQAVPKGGSR